MATDRVTIDPRTIALVAFLTTMTIVFTLADVGVYFVGFALRPVIGFVVGGLGTGLADVLGGTPTSLSGRS